MVVQEDGARSLRDMRWWLVPSWAPEVSTRYSMFNARAENLDSSRAFKGPFRHHRGVVPASSFIEWQKINDLKMPWLIRARDGALAFAAVWDTWTRDGNYLESCAIVTTDATPGFKHLHNRMPVMLRPEEFDVWLDPARPLQEVRTLLEPALPGPMEIAPLDRAVNNSRGKGEDLLVPIADAEEIDDQQT